MRVFIMTNLVRWFKTGKIVSFYEDTSCNGALVSESYQVVPSLVHVNSSPFAF